MNVQPIIDSIADIIKGNPFGVGLLFFICLFFLTITISGYLEQKNIK